MRCLVPIQIDSQFGGIKIKKIQTCLLTILLFISLYSIFLPSFCSAQNVLEIHGPSAVFEGDEVEFMVTLDGEPVQAHIIFDDVYPASYTNSTTGKISFIAPPVEYGEKQYIITASILDEISVSHVLFVKSKTAVLFVSFSDDYIIETQEFKVSVTDGKQGVDDAHVWFDSELYRTDSLGEVVLTAPDVLVTTNYGLIVNKSGYQSFSTMITIYEYTRGIQLMEVFIPSIIEPGRDDGEIKVFSKLGPLENVSVDLYYEGELFESYRTDSSGRVLFSSPHINYDHFFTVTVFKEGYQTFFDEEQYYISLFRKDFLSDLFIAVIPSEIQEGSVVTVKVTNDIGLGISDVTIWRGSDELDGMTDSEGLLNFFTPPVFMDTQFYIYAIKPGFNFAESFITVRDMSEDTAKLFIEAPSFVNESEAFSVIVKDEHNVTLPGAMVVFHSQKQFTNELGLVYFYAPAVAVSSFYTIEVYKAGYVPAFFLIEVLSKEGPTEPLSRKLQISIQPTIFEKEIFIVTIRDGLGNPVSNAQVSFRGTTLHTNFRGEAKFSTPEVDWDEVHLITVTKAGYTSTSTNVVIKNIQGFDYWYLIVIFTAVFIIGIAAYIRYTRYY
ncbi:MAG: hypothetical protein R6V50_03425 [Thermoplasmatota archaeon]